MPVRRVGQNANNRPANELELTRGSWRNVWFDDEDINRASGFAELRRSTIFQIVEDDYYLNVAESRLFGVSFLPITSVLRGDYEIVDPATPASAGEPRRNVIKLRFAGNRARLGRLPTDESIRDLAVAVDAGDKLSIPIPGPRGITGELWNLYVDDDIRVAAGNQDGDPGVTDLYILVRSDRRTR